MTFLPLFFTLWAFALLVLLALAKACAPLTTRRP